MTTTTTTTTTTNPGTASRWLYITTGGGHGALMRTLPAGRVAVLTTEDGERAPTPSEACLVGVYDNQDALMNDAPRTSQVCANRAEADAWLATQVCAWLQDEASEADIDALIGDEHGLLVGNFTAAEIAAIAGNTAAGEWREVACTFLDAPLPTFAELVEMNRARLQRAYNDEPEDDYPRAVHATVLSYTSEAATAILQSAPSAWRACIDASDGAAALLARAVASVALNESAPAAPDAGERTDVQTALEALTAQDAADLLAALDLGATMTDPDDDDDLSDRAHRAQVEARATLRAKVAAIYAALAASERA